MNTPVIILSTRGDIGADGAPDRQARHTPKSKSRCPETEAPPSAGLPGSQFITAPSGSNDCLTGNR